MPEGLPPPRSGRVHPWGEVGGSPTWGPGWGVLGVVEGRGRQPCDEAAALRAASLWEQEASTLQTQGGSAERWVPCVPIPRGSPPCALPPPCVCVSARLLRVFCL